MTSTSSSTASAISLRAGTLLAPQLDYVLLDGSGSMQSKWWATLGTIDTFMECLRAQNIASHGILHIFDSLDKDLIVRDNIIAEWPTFATDPVGAHWGGTPLYDAINIMGRRLSDLNPPRASLVIVTDGDENASKTNVTQARSILDWCRAKGWQITFLGADFNNQRQAKLLGANEANSVGVQGTKLLAAGKALGDKRVRNALYGEDINFSEDERQTFGGYLTGPQS